jgi:hypothetical protein
VSESRTAYVSCAAGYELMADLAVRRVGGLVEIDAPRRAHLAPTEVARLIELLAALLAEIAPPAAT